MARAPGMRDSEPVHAEFLLDLLVFPNPDNTVCTPPETPDAIALDASGRIYIVNHASSTVLRMSTMTGSDALTVSGYTCASIAVNANGRCFLSDVATGEIILLDDLQEAGQYTTGICITPSGIADTGSGVTSLPMRGRDGSRSTALTRSFPDPAGSRWMPGVLRTSPTPTTTGSSV